MFEGSLVALVTPFRNGEFDRDACADLIDHQLQEGTQGLVVAGTTGEAPTLSADEKHTLLKFVVERAAGRVPVLAGTGSYDTRGTIEGTRAAAKAGADGALVVAPYYNRPGDRGLREHFLAVANDGGLPVLLYNIPSRTSSRIAPPLVRELCEHPSIVGIKDASGSPAEAMELVEAGVMVLAGDDAVTVPWMALGAKGVVSVAGNVVPGEISALVAEAAAGRFEDARKRHYRLLPLFRALFLESNPVPVKALLADLDRGTAEVRLPLVEATEGTVAALRQVAEELGLRRRSFEAGVN